MHLNEDLDYSSWGHRNRKFGLFAEYFAFSPKKILRARSEFDTSPELNIIPFEESRPDFRLIATQIILRVFDWRSCLTCEARL
jgi:hypothetical protein